MLDVLVYAWRLEPGTRAVLLDVQWQQQEMLPLVTLVVVHLVEYQQ